MNLDWPSMDSSWNAWENTIHFDKAVASVAAESFSCITNRECFNEEVLDHEKVTIPTIKKTHIFADSKGQVLVPVVSKTASLQRIFLLGMPTLGFPRGGRVQAFREAPEAQKFWISVQIDSHTVCLWFLKCSDLMLVNLELSHFFYQCLEKVDKNQQIRWRGHGGKCNASTGDSFTCTLEFRYKFRWDVNRLVSTSLKKWRKDMILIY